MLSLSRATPSQYSQTIENNFGEWGSPHLTREQYRDRESTLSKETFAVDGHDCWVLVDSETNGSAEILAACETYRRPCCYAIAGKWVQGVCYSIASVFTPEKFRGKGYASKMMVLLRQELQKDPECLGSTLYSDVGPKFYDRLGWKLLPSVSYEVQVKDIASSFHDASPSALELTVDDLSSLVHKENEKIKGALIEQSLSSDKIIFNVLLTESALRWRLKRAEFYAQALHRKRSSIGATHCEDYAIWFHDFKTDTLEFLRFQCTSHESVQSILAKAVQECLHSGLKAIHIWDPSIKQRDAVPSVGITKDREDALSSVLIFDHTDVDIHWYQNESFAWV